MDRQGTLRICAAAITTAIVLAACASSPAATPSPSPSPVASGSPGASPVASVASCADTDLDASITKWDGAAGSQIATITVKNIGGDTCVLGAPTAEQLLDGLGQLPVTSTGDKAVGGELTLASDKSAQLLVRVANWCTSAPSDKVSIGVTLTGGSSFVAEPAKDVTFTPPPCNGAKQPTTLDVQSAGWTAPTATVPRDAFSSGGATA
jgi:hypothetical protein